MRAARLNPLSTVLIGIAFVLGCGDMGCGCEVDPLDRDLDDADKVYDGVLIEISPEGFTFIEMNFDAILETFLDGGLSFPLPADPGDTCPESGCSGQRICNRDDDCPISAELRNIEILRNEPNVLKFRADLFVHSGTDPMGPAERIPVRVCQSTLWCNNVSCDFRLHIGGKPVALEVIFDIDPVSKALSFDLTEPSIEVVSADYTISGGATCWIVENLFKGMLTNMINDMIQEQVVDEIRETIDEMTCMTCDYYALGCEAGTRSPGVTCDTATNWCMRQGECVRAPMGFSGKLDFATLLEDMGLPSTLLGLHVGVGQRLSPWGDPFVPYPNGPLQLRAITGAAAEQSSHCVPEPSVMPNTEPPPRIDFVAESGGLTYHVGLGISDRFLNKTIFEAYRGGAMCLDIGSEVSDMVSTGLLTAFLPSLGVLTENQSSPVYIAVRPKDRPEIHIGKGTYRMEGSERVMDEPLLTLLMNDVHMDFYAFFEERYFRVFTLEVDVALPLGLEITAANELFPTLGALDEMVTGVEVSNSKILAEDPQVLADIIPIIISLVEPMMGEVLDPIPLPDIQGFRLDVVKMEGVVPHAESDRYEHLGLFAKLELAGSRSPATHVPPTIDLRDVRQPARSGIDGVRIDRSIERPSLVVTARPNGDEPIEWQYRIDGGFWSPFQTATELEIESPKLLLQGRHRIEVRSREAGRPATLDAEPVRFDFLIDWTAPSARILVDPATGIAEVLAEDLVSPAGRLEYSFAVDGGAFGAFGPSSIFELPRGASLLEVRVRDEAGNIGQARWEETAQAFGTETGSGTSSPEAAGCAVGGGNGLSLAVSVLLLALLALSRRRAR